MRPATLVVASILLVAGLMAVGCRPGAEPVPAESRLSLERVALLADEATGDFDFAGTIGQWAAASVGPDRVAFLDQERNRVVVLDTTGRVVASFGRKGGGPGEFANPRFLMYRDSGLAVYDGLKFALVGFDLNGRPQPDVSQTTTIGAPEGILTGMAPLAHGAWVYSVTESVGSRVREALYLRSNGVTRLLASTPEAPNRLLRLPCGITMNGGAPVLWPTLRWAATPTRVAYAATADDRVVVWDGLHGDSTILVGSAPPRHATRSAALAAAAGYIVQTPGKRCAIEKQQVLDQRGMMKTMAPIDAVALSPAGVLWVRLSAAPGEPSMIRVRDRQTTDSLVSSVFPGFFLSNSRFVAEERDSAGNLVAALWEVRRRK